MIIHLVPTLPSESNGLPRGFSEADRFIPPYLAFLPVGFAMPPTSPPGRWALTLSRGPGVYPKRQPRHFTLIPSEDETVYFLLHFPSRHRDSALRSTASYGARTFLPSLLLRKQQAPATTSSTLLFLIRPYRCLNTISFHSYGKR